MSLPPGVKREPLYHFPHWDEPGHIVMVRAHADMSNAKGYASLILDGTEEELQAVWSAVCWSLREGRLPDNAQSVALMRRWFNGGLTTL